MKKFLIFSVLCVSTHLYSSEGHEKQLQFHDYDVSMGTPLRKLPKLGKSELDVLRHFRFLIKCGQFPTILNLEMKAAFAKAHYLTTGQLDKLLFILNYEIQVQNLLDWAETHNDLTSEDLGMLTYQTGWSIDEIMNWFLENRDMLSKMTENQKQQYYERQDAMHAHYKAIMTSDYYIDEQGMLGLEEQAMALRLNKFY